MSSLVAALGSCVGKAPMPSSNVVFSQGAKESIADLEEIVTRWAKMLFDLTKNKEQAKLDKSFLQFNINWKHLRFHFDEPDFDIIPWTATAQKGPKQSVQPQILFRTVFTNSTGKEQEYSFKTERVTRSCATICIEQGFSRETGFEIKIKTPGEVAEAGAGFKRELSVANIGEDTIEEELTWGVDSSVRVPPRTEAVAELVISEANTQGEFKMQTQFHGRILVTVTNLKENNALVTILEGNIADIIQREIKEARGLKGFRIEGKTVYVETRGRCNFKFGIEQRVLIQERPISNGPNL